MSTQEALAVEESSAALAMQKVSQMLPHLAAEDRLIRTGCTRSQQVELLAEAAAAVFLH